MRDTSKTVNATHIYDVKVPYYTQTHLKLVDSDHTSDTNTRNRYGSHAPLSLTATDPLSTSTEPPPCAISWAAALNCSRWSTPTRCARRELLREMRWLAMPSPCMSPTDGSRAEHMVAVDLNHAAAPIRAAEAVRHKSPLHLEALMLHSRAG